MHISVRRPLSTTNSRKGKVLHQGHYRLHQQTVPYYKKINNDSLLVSLDVISLYTNIPNKEGAEATYDALETHRDTDEKLIALVSTHTEQLSV